MSKAINTSVSVFSALVVATTLAVTAPVDVQALTNVTSQVSSTVAPIEIPVTTVVRGANGSETIVKTVTVANGEYTVKVVAKNQGSVHPNNDIIVRSGSDQVVVADVEREAFGEQTANGTLIVSDGAVKIVVKLGKDKVFSGGMNVVLTHVPITPEEPEVPEVPETPEIPEVPETPGQVLPATLPETGIATFGSLAGIGSIAYSATRLLQSRRQ